MKYKVIIFDKDGTLLDFDKFWLGVSDAAIADILKEAKCDASIEEIYNSMGVYNGITDISGILARGTYEQMGEAIYGVLEKHNCLLGKEEVTKITVEAYHKNFNHGKVIPTCENLKEMLNSLLNLGIKLAVVTTDDSYFTEKCLNELGVKDCFDILLCNDGEFPHKPDPYGIELIKKHFGVTNDEILMVGDTITDMQFAKNGKVDAIGVGKTEKARKILGEYTEKTFPDVSYVPSAIN